MRRAGPPRRSLTAIGNLAVALGLFSLLLTSAVWMTGTGHKTLPTILAICAGVAALARLGTAAWLTWHPHHARERLRDTPLQLWAVAGVAVLTQVVCLAVALMGNAGGAVDAVAVVALIAVCVCVVRLARPKVELVVDRDSVPGH